MAIGAGEGTRGAGTLVPLDHTGLGTQVDAHDRACAVSFAESLVEPSESLTWCHTGGDVPSLASLLSHDPRQINFVFLTTVVLPFNFVCVKKKKIGQSWP